MPSVLLMWMVPKLNNEDTQAKYSRGQYFKNIRFLLSLKWHKGINLTEPAEYCSMISQEERAEAVCRKKQV